MLVPVAARALVALAAALAGYVMVKFYGVIFLGQPREPTSRARARRRPLRARRRWSGSPRGCVLLGLLPGAVSSQLIDPVDAQLVGAGARRRRRRRAGWLLVPIDADRASYSPLIVPAR